MQTGHPEWALEGAAPRHDPAVALAAPDGLTTSGFARFLDRILSIGCLLGLVPIMLAAHEQFNHLDRLWLAVIGGSLVASASLMPLYAWSRRGIRPLATLFAAAIFLGLVSWPFAWNTPAAATAAPMVALLFGFGTVCVGLVFSSGAATAYALACALVYFVVRMLPAGGAAGPLVSLSDAMAQAVLPLAILYLAQHVRGAVLRLDRTLARAHAETADAAVNKALVDERRRLDALIHDEIMTTLVAGAKSRTEHDVHVAEQARAALSALDAEAESDDEGVRVSADQLVRLVKDVAASVCPRAEVLAEIPGAAVTLPQVVARALLQATREAVLNAEKHADAEHVQVFVQVLPAGRRVTAKVSVADDGRGFDPASVPSRRLGIRLALKGRMEAAGGTASVTAAPGRGTTVRLAWSGERVRTASRLPRTVLDYSRHPLFAGVDSRAVGTVLVGLTAVCLVIGCLAAAQSTRPAPLVVAMALTIVGIVIGVPRLGSPPLRAVWCWTLAACATGVAGLSVLALPSGPWPDHATWFAAPASLLLLIAYAGGRPLAAWAGALASGGLVVVRAVQTDQAPSLVLLAAATPAAWVALEALCFRWFDAIWAEIDEADASAVEAARLNATMFGKLVLREVWLTELKSEVGAMLTKLADPTQPLTPDDRSDMLLLEGSLRDGIKAANFTSPALSAAIMGARHRGVQVTLVDNRGAALPEPARRAALRYLEAEVAAATGGRIVARTAPDGYADAVTIVSVDAAGVSHLARIGKDGSVSSGVPATSAD